MEGYGSIKTLDDFFDKIYIINLPSRNDRLNSIYKELNYLGVRCDSLKILVPEAPVFDDAGGFPTKGVRGNFYSHLQNIEDACDNGFERILVLEDDAIFRSHLRRRDYQNFLLSKVEGHRWSMWFPGHFLTAHPDKAPKPVYQTTAGFKWAHCYAVHRRGMQALRDYLRLVSDRPAGHPEGGKMYIDGALHHFRRQFMDQVCLVSNPVLSIQKSSDTNLGLRQNSFHQGGAPLLKALARNAKDELWRRTGIRFALT
jgi:GR25 family glycosyltransferase involved in LPS biosynthesis